MPERPEVADHYSAQYGQFADGVHEKVRRAAFGEDIGQNSWLTVDELDRFSRSLELGPTSRLLDVACGSGGPALHLAQRTGCEIVGVELYEEAVESGNRLAADAGLVERATFRQADASLPLPRRRLVRRDSLHRCDQPSPRPTERSRRLGPLARIGRATPLHRSADGDRRSRQ